MSLTATGYQGHDRIVDFRLFHSRMIRPAGRGPDLPETNACAWWLDTGSKSSMNRLFINIDAQDAQDFSGDGWLVFPDILKSARDHRPSQRLLQQPPVLIILCILCIDVQFIVLLDGSAQSRGAGARLAGKREFPKGDRPAFREVARRIPPTSPSGRHPPGARASRPHAVPSVAAQFPCDVAADRPAGGNSSGQAEAEAGRRCRLIPVEEMAEAAGGFVRAGRPRSRVGFLP